MGDGSARLSSVARRVMACRGCPLWMSRTRAVPGKGRAGARVMLVGEGPGRQEDVQGEPFVGAAGKRLDSLLREARLDRQEDVFTTNAVKCRPPANRRPRKAELAACRGYLLEQIGAVSPRIVVLLGDVALKEFFPGKSLGQLHGKVVRQGTERFFPVYHPAAAIYNPGLKRVMIADFERLGRELGRGDDGV